MTSPAISVLMPVYNAGKYIELAIDSILKQTFKDFEFIIINDGSTDESLEIIKTSRDKRIVILNNKQNFGNYHSRNQGYEKARGKYICVMDADDIAFPQRLEKQYIFMEENCEIGIAGTGYRIGDFNENCYSERNFEQIKVLLIRNNCMLHPSLIMRKELLKKYNLLYDENYYYSADFDLLVRAARYFPITNLNEVLMYYRRHDNQISTEFWHKQRFFANEIVLKQISHIGILPSKEEEKTHINFVRGIVQSVPKIIKWVNKIKSANTKIGYYKQEYLDNFFNSILTHASN